MNEIRDLVERWDLVWRIAAAVWVTALTLWVVAVTVWLSFMEGGEG